MFYIYLPRRKRYARRCEYNATRLKQTKMTVVAMKAVGTMLKKKTSAKKQIE